MVYVCVRMCCVRFCFWSIRDVILKTFKTIAPNTRCSRPTSHRKRPVLLVRYFVTVFLSTMSTKCVHVLAPAIKFYVLQVQNTAIAMIWTSYYRTVHKEMRRICTCQSLHFGHVLEEKKCPIWIRDVAKADVSSIKECLIRTNIKDLIHIRKLIYGLKAHEIRYKK